LTPDARLAAQFAFLNGADRLKSVLRATTLCDGSRRENSGEHSWHLALYAMVLADQAAPGADITRVIRMLLIHDLVEIDVGDVPIHSAIRPQPSAPCGKSSRPPKRLMPVSPNRWTACSR